MLAPPFTLPCQTLLVPRHGIVELCWSRSRRAGNCPRRDHCMRTGLFARRVHDTIEASAPASRRSACSRLGNVSAPRNLLTPTAGPATPAAASRQQGTALLPLRRSRGGHTRG